MTGTTTVECPLCGIRGKLIVDGDNVRVEFPPEQQARSRYTREGLQEHYLEINGFVKGIGPKLEAGKEKIDAGLKEFTEYLA
jgi:hypothetical protein